MVIWRIRVTINNKSYGSEKIKFHKTLFQNIPPLSLIFNIYFLFSCELCAKGNEFGVYITFLIIYMNNCVNF
jgi:hypothetical protein